jgi:hypothetical protein
MDEFGRRPVAASPRTIRVTGPIILDFGNGLRMQLSPLPSGHAGADPVASGKRRGRKPSPATQALIDAMQADAASEAPRSRAEYLKVLEDAGHKSATTASLIIAREAKRAFGKPLGRGKGAPIKRVRPVVYRELRAAKQ